MIVDFDKTSGALLSLKSSAGAGALDELYGHLGTFRAKIGKNLNDGEFRYVMQTLFNEQVVTEPKKGDTAPALLAHGFTIRSVR